MSTPKTPEIKVPRRPDLRRSKGHVSRAARDLEISPGHLLRVIKNERQSPEQKARYLEWCQQAGVSPACR